MFWALVIMHNNAKAIVIDICFIFYIFGGVIDMDSLLHSSRRSESPDLPLIVSFVTKQEINLRVFMSISLSPIR